MENRVKQMENRIQREIEEKEGLLQDLEEVKNLKLATLDFHKERLIWVKDYGIKYNDAKESLFENLSFQVNRGDRIAIVGKNGCGKSTLIKRILEKSGYREESLPIAESGVCEVTSGLKISYINQDTSGLKGDIMTYCREKGIDRSFFCALLRQLDFERVQFEKRMEEYSEGQKKKVLIATSLLTPAHLYIWDEPLNYIDVFSRIQIETLLKTYQPTMLFVEHDVRFCENFATKKVEF